MADTPQWVNRIIGHDASVDPEQLLANPFNARIHTAIQEAGLKSVMDEIGWIDDVTVNTTTDHVVDGHLRVSMAIKYGQRVPVKYVELTESEEKTILLTFDWISRLAGYDRDIVSDLMSAIETNSDSLQALLNDLAETQGVDLSSFEDAAPLPEEEFTRAAVPDALWATDNDYELPLLDITMQADAVDLPFAIWGNTSRSTRMKGTWGFYTEDCRYEALWTDPSPVLNSMCINAIEPNFSCYSQMPLPVGLWAIYRKRWIARYWQSKGIRVFVDLNVNEKFYDINMMGVPQGWKAYATRGYSDRLALTDQEYAMACERAGESSILFVVYGGGKAVKAHCQSKGYIWFDEVMNYG